MSFSPKLRDVLLKTRACLEGLSEANRVGMLPAETMRVCNAIDKQLGDIDCVRPSNFDLDDAYREIKAIWSEQGTLRNLSRKMQRIVPWVLFYPENEKRKWLARDIIFLKCLASMVLEKNAVRSVVAILKVFMLRYPNDWEIRGAITAMLIECLDKMTSRRLLLWKNRCERYGILKGDTERTIATRISTCEEKIGDVLADVGFDERLMQGELFRAVMHSILNGLRHGLETGRVDQSGFERYAAFLFSDENGLADRWQSEIAQSLLVPFTDRNPEIRLKTKICDLLISAYGDPRTRKSGWITVPELTRLVLLRWLVQDTLEFFFKLLDKTAMESHWRERRAFWLAYLRNNVIQGAWVVLGSRAKRLALSIGEDVGKHATLLSGNGVLPDHSVLILKLAGLTIVEWSHMGKCRIWLEDAKSVPDLYKSKYRRSDLVKGASEEFVHHRGWRGNVADYIRKMTGVRIR